MATNWSSGPIDQTNKHNSNFNSIKFDGGVMKAQLTFDSTIHTKFMQVRIMWYEKKIKTKNYARLELSERVEKTQPILHVIIYESHKWVKII